MGYRNGTLYASYTAASFARVQDIADRHGVNMEGALTWAFEFEDQPYFAGFRQLMSSGIDLPVLNVFRMMSRMRGQRLTVDSTADAGLAALQKAGVRGAPDVSALAASDGQRVTALAWHYHDDDLPGPDAAVELTVSGLPGNWGKKTLSHFRIDETHSNAFTVWKQHGFAPTADDGAGDADRAGRTAHAASCAGAGAGGERDAGGAVPPAPSGGVFAGLGVSEGNSALGRGG